jgi:FkbM family methyltransferase
MKNQIVIALDKIFVRIHTAFSNTVHSARLLLSPQQKILAEWHSFDWTGLQRSNFSINTTDVVIDGGGYMGQWSSDIAARFNPNIYTFEPIMEFSEIIADRFVLNSKVKVINAGLSAKNGKASFSRIGDATKATSDPNQPASALETVELVNFVEFLEKNHIEEVALLKLNIEGGEYDVLEQLLDTGRIHSVKNILVQFHDFEAGQNSRRSAIVAQLEQDFKTVFSYPFVWECYKRKSESD